MQPLKGSCIVQLLFCFEIAALHSIAQLEEIVYLHAEYGIFGLCFQGCECVLHQRLHIIA